jgi:hypothetical protein
VIVELGESQPRKIDEVDVLNMAFIEVNIIPIMDTLFS